MLLLWLSFEERVEEKDDTIRPYFAPSQDVMLSVEKGHSPPQKNNYDHTKKLARIRRIIIHDNDKILPPTTQLARLKIII